MTATERAKRSDALYYETVSVNRRVLCDMVANREADLDATRDLCRQLWQRLRWADEVLDGGVIDARMARAAKKLGVDE